MNEKNVFSGKQLPELVFAEPFKYYCFSGYNDIFANQIVDFLNICQAYCLKYGETSQWIAERTIDGNLKHRKDFGIGPDEGKKMVKYIQHFALEDYETVPHFVLIAQQLVFTTINGKIAIYAERDYDVVIIGTNDEELIKFAKAVPGDHTYLNDIDTYLTFLNNISGRVPERNAIIDTFRKNYSGQ